MTTESMLNRQLVALLQKIQAKNGEMTVQDYLMAHQMHLMGSLFLGGEHSVTKHLALVVQRYKGYWN